VDAGGTGACKKERTSKRGPESLHIGLLPLLYNQMVHAKKTRESPFLVAVRESEIGSIRFDDSYVRSKAPRDDK